MNEKLGKFVRLLASDQPGEVVAAVQAIKRELQTFNLDMNDFAAKIEWLDITPKRRKRQKPLDAWAQQQREEDLDSLNFCLSNDDLLSDWEFNFVVSVDDQLQKYGRLMTQKQRDVVDKIKEKLRSKNAV